MSCECTPKGTVGSSSSSFVANASNAGSSVGTQGISEEAWRKAASEIGCEVEALKAVVKVESGKAGFLKDGRPKILFEGHVFWSQLKKAGLQPTNYSNGNTDILYPSFDRSKYKGGAAEYDRLERAKNIGGNNKTIEECALKSASWGMFQVMGFNYASTGCGSVYEMIEKMYKSADEQFKLGVEFIKKHPKQKEGLITKNWEMFARSYNGSGYKKGRYDEKIANAYASFKNGSK